MRTGSILTVSSLAVLSILSLVLLCALGQTNSTRSLITQPVIETNRITLPGNTHPLARREFDRGAAPLGVSMERMLLVLKRSSELESALRKVLDEQLNGASPNFHKWLTPEQFGRQFGASDEDIRSVTSWLESHGLQAARVSKGRTVIEFSGKVAQVQDTFHTAIHKYVIAGEEHWANETDPQIPIALAPVVAGVAALHDFPKRPLIRGLGAFLRAKATGEIKPVTPLVTISSPCGAAGFQTSKSCYGLGPYDFAAIYNVLPLWNAGIDGSGQTIAIAAASNINLADVRNFKSVFGLPPPTIR
jgi:subtilase family serine protease